MTLFPLLLNPIACSANEDNRKESQTKITQPTSTKVTRAGTFTVDLGFGPLQLPRAYQQHCPAYENSRLYRQRERIVHVKSVEELQKAISNSRVNDEIVLADGLYKVPGSIWINAENLTIRGKNQNAEKVVIRGPGLSEKGEGFVLNAKGISLANLTIEGFRDHGVHIKGGKAEDTYLYNLKIFDIGTQLIKGSNSKVPHGGIIACSKIGYKNGAKGDYINGIDIQGARNWFIRDNIIYDIWGEGNGCTVDTGCGRHYRGGGPALLLWRNASNNHIIRNYFVNNFRSIALGFGTDYFGGEIRNNLIIRTKASQNGISGDMGISLDKAKNVLVRNNIVLFTDKNDRYPGAIEIRNSQRIQVIDNRIDRRLSKRGENKTLFETGNTTNLQLRDLQ